MSAEDVRVWGIHSRADKLFLKENTVAIGWNEMGDLNLIKPDRASFKEKYIQVYPDAKKGSIATGAGMLYRFCHEMQVGDYIVFPSKSNREINIGKVEGNYVYDPSQIEYVQTRKVKWLKHFPRTSFSQGALYEVGSAMTFFAVKNYADEFLSALEAGFSKKTNQEDDDPSVKATADEIIESTKDFILKELSRNLKGYDLENFVAALLEAMGYRTIVSKHGGDRGIDIKAYENEFPPRIVVQVKSKDSDVKESDVQALKGLMKPGDYGLFFALSGFTKNAEKFLSETPDIRAFDGSAFVDLILKYYDKLDTKYKAIIPLKMVYIPVSQDMI